MNLRPVKVVASYCVTFLMPEMLHVYRQLTGLQTFRPHVLTQKWVYRERFPVSFPVEVLPKSRVRALRRAWFKQLLDAPVLISRRQRDALSASLEKSGADLLHIYFGNIGVYLLPWLRQKTLPVVVSFHGADAGVDHGKSAHRKAIEEVFQLADRILVRSAALGEELKALGCPEEKIRLSRTGIPMADWEFQERKPPEDGEWRLLQACRFMEKKGLDTTLKVFAELQNEYPNARLTLAGEGSLLQPMQDLAEEMGLAEAVDFPGFLDQSELQAVMNESHLFIHPSRTSADGNQEGVPNSMLEAMACGLPVIATNHGGIPEAMTQGEGGFLTDVDDVSSLAEACRTLMQSPDRLAEMSRAARASVAERFDQKAQIRQLEAIYTELTS